jgi:hypothetical protein
MAILRKRQREFIAPFVLVSWLFAIFVSIANACGLNEYLGQAGPIQTAIVAAHAGSADDASPICDRYCADDLPLLAKVKGVQDPPTEQVLLVAATPGNALQAATAPVSPLLTRPDPPPGIAVNTRFARLAL